MNFSNKHTMFTPTKASNYPFTNKAFQNSCYLFPKKNQETMEETLNFNLSVLRQFLTLD